MNRINLLKMQLDALSNIEKSLNEQTEKINKIDGIIGDIDQKSSEMFKDCNVILTKRNEIETKLKSVDKELRYYDIFDELNNAFMDPKAIDFYSEKFQQDFKEINLCIDYFHEKVC